MTLLIVEDKTYLLRFLEDSFRRDGYNVVGCGRIEELEALVSMDGQEPPSVIVLDRLLHDVDSVSMIPKLKKRFPGTRIIVLSAIGGAQEKGRVLDMGADDYVSKPFSIEELGARVRVLLRASKAQPAPVLALGNVVMGLLGQTVDVAGHRLSLPRKEYLLLKTFMENPTRVFNRYQLLDLVWEVHSEAETNVVEVTVKNLRKKLESVGATVKILSKRYAGYWIEA